MGKIFDLNDVEKIHRCVADRSVMETTHRRFLTGIEREI